MTFTNSTTANDLLARFDPYTVVPSALGLFDCGVSYDLPALNNGYWTITSTPSTSTGTYTATLFNTPGTYSNSGGASTWTVMKKPSSGTWVLEGTCAPSTVSQVVRVGMSGFSQFGTAQSSLILPVELISFTGEVTDHGNLIQWTTDSEYNNDYFSLEKSFDGLGFAEITRLDGSENTLMQSHYQYLDDNRFAGDNYYRLRQVNLDGSFGYSNVILLQNEIVSPVFNAVTPNPSSGAITISLSTSQGGLADFSVIDLFGRDLFRYSKYIETGKALIDINLTHLPKGIYFIRCSLKEYGFVDLEKIILE